MNKNIKELFKITAEAIRDAQDKIELVELLTEAYTKIYPDFNYQAFENIALEYESSDDKTPREQLEFNF